GRRAGAERHRLQADVARSVALLADEVVGVFLRIAGEEHDAEAADGTHLDEPALDLETAGGGEGLVDVGGEPADARLLLVLLAAGGLGGSEDDVRGLAVAEG